MVERFSSGNLTADELKKWVNSQKGLYKLTEDTSNPDIYNFTITDNTYHVSYNIKCSKKAAASGTDNEQVMTYTADEIKKHSDLAMSRLRSILM